MATRTSLRRRASEIKLSLITYYIADLPLRDQRETMERPFFSLSKRKRMRPIDYVSPDGSVWVKIAPHQDHGMATIWDADILIWAASQIMETIRSGREPSPSLRFHPNELLRSIGRDYGTSSAGGKTYENLKDALNRLKSTLIQTNIRSQEGNRTRREEGAFSWLNEWSYVKEDGEADKMEIELSRWVYQGIIQAGGVLAIDPAYFRIGGGLERALYRIARKHVGSQEEWRISMRLLHEKSGSDSPMFEFRRMMKRIAASSNLPGYRVSLDGDTATFRKHV